MDMISLDVFEPLTQKNLVKIASLTELSDIVAPTDNEVIVLTANHPTSENVDKGKSKASITQDLQEISSASSSDAEIEETIHESRLTYFNSQRVGESSSQGGRGEYGLSGIHNGNTQIEVINPCNIPLPIETLDEHTELLYPGEPRFLKEAYSDESSDLTSSSGSISSLFDKINSKSSSGKLTIEKLEKLHYKDRRATFTDPITSHLECLIGGLANNTEYSDIAHKYLHSVSTLEDLIEMEEALTRDIDIASGLVLEQIRNDAVLEPLEQSVRDEYLSIMSSSTSLLLGERDELFRDMSIGDYAQLMTRREGAISA